MKTRIGLLGLLGVWAWGMVGGTAFATSYGLFVGLNEYNISYIPENNWLECCTNDAVAFRSALLSNGGGWTSTTVSNLLNSAGTKVDIRRAISNFAQQAVSGDTFVYFHSSHGGNADMTRADVYLCAYNANYTEDELAQDLSTFRAGVNVIVAVDACHSGGLFTDATRASSLSPSQRRAKARALAAQWNLAERVTARMKEHRAALAARSPRAAARIIAPDEVGWLTACAYNESSYEAASVGHGYFTMQLLNAFDYGDTDGDGKATFLELFDFAAIRISAVDQNPQSFNPDVLRRVFAATSGVAAAPAGDEWDYADNLMDMTPTPLVLASAEQTHGPHTLNMIFDPADCFAIPVQANRTVTFASEGANDVDAELYDSQFRLIRQAWDNSSSDYNFTMAYKPFADDTVYLRVFPYETNETYTLRYVQRPGEDHCITTLYPPCTQTVASLPEGGYENYRVVVPPDRTQLSFTLSGGSGDSDLYLGKGYLPLSDWDEDSTATGNTESIDVQSPEAAEWFIQVYAYDASANMKLGVSYTPAYTGKISADLADFSITNTSTGLVASAGIYYADFQPAPSVFPVYFTTHLQPPSWQFLTNVNMTDDSVVLPSGPAAGFLSIGNPVSR